MTKQTHFTIPIRVYYEDTDAGGVVYHSNYINFFERARTEWLRHLGYEMDELALSEQLVFVVRALNCDYLLPARFNDELIVSAEIVSIGNTSIVFKQQVRRASDDTVLAEGSVTVVSVDAQTFRPKRMPAPIMEKIKSVI